MLDPTELLRCHHSSGNVINENKVSNLNQRKNHRSAPWDYENRLSNLRRCLKSWADVEVCPLEDPDIHWSPTELGENNALFQQYSNNLMATSDEETDDDSEALHVNSSDNCRLSNSRSNYFRSHQPARTQAPNSNGSLTSEERICPAGENHGSGTNGEDPSRKRKRRSRRSKCKIPRKDLCTRFLRPRTIFHKALDATDMLWTDPLLIKIIHYGEIPCKYSSIVATKAIPLRTNDFLLQQILFYI